MSNKVLLILVDQIITAKHYSYIFGDTNQDYLGVCVATENDDSVMYCIEDSPTIADYYGIAVDHDASYGEKKQAILSATGWGHKEEFEWLFPDHDGLAPAKPDTDQTITEWLRKPLAKCMREPYLDFYYGLLAREASEHTPGFLILRSLPSEARMELGIAEVDKGGPASSVPCVKALASIKDLNLAMEYHKLPFAFTQDDD